MTALLAAALLSSCLMSTGSQGTASSQLKKFGSVEELREFLRIRARSMPSYDLLELGSPPATAMGLEKSAEAPAPASPEHSSTNIQVPGVDEADIVKNDGRYIYALSKGRLVIIDAYPPEKARKLSAIELEDGARELFINGDRVIVLGDKAAARGYYALKAVALVYDVSDRSKPVLLQEVSVDGRYLDSRMIGEHVYLIATHPAWYENLKVPVVEARGRVNSSERPDVYYFDVPDYAYTFTTIASLNVGDENPDVKAKLYLLGAAQTLYVSQSNIYIAYQRMPELYAEVEVKPVLPPQWTGVERTLIHRIAIEDGEIEYAGSGEVPGHLLNQFSMDEYNGMLRIATTRGYVAWRRGAPASSNNIYVLDRSLRVIGSLEGLAPGERIYAARFLGERAYLVTFKKVDPLFVVDLTDPERPRALGELKIPGYSDYLHPYDENHLIGVGKDAVEAGTGEFAWYQGLKLALFDVSDVEHPRELSSVIIGDRGTDSPVLHDHKALLFSREKRLLAIPVQVAKLQDDVAPLEVIPKWAYGKYVWQGVYVYSVDPAKGFRLKGMVSHGPPFDPGSSIKRSLYIGNTLYTFSERMVKMNDLDSLAEIGALDL